VSEAVSAREKRRAIGVENTSRCTAIIFTNTGGCYALSINNLAICFISIVLVVNILSGEGVSLDLDHALQIH